MSIFSRIAAIFRARASSIADGVEDPKLSLDYSLYKLEENRQEMSRSLIEITTARKQLESTYAGLSDAVEKYQEQARTAIDLGRDDLARKALERKQDAQERMGELEANLSELDNQLINLKQSQADLSRKMELFQSKKEELKAVYDASRTQIRLKEQIYGISNDLMNFGATIRRAEDRIQQMRARAQAIDGLVQEGVLRDALEPNKDDVDRELARLSRGQLVEEELARLKSPVKIERPEKSLPNFVPPADKEEGSES
jgi:phage shock protein A